MNKVYNEISLQFPCFSHDFMTLTTSLHYKRQKIRYWTTDNIYKGLESSQTFTHITTDSFAKAWPASELAFQMCYRSVYYLQVRVWKWPVFLSVRAQFQNLNGPELWQRWHSISEHGCLTQVGKISFYGSPVLVHTVCGWLKLFPSNLEPHRKTEAFALPCVSSEWGASLSHKSALES